MRPFTTSLIVLFLGLLAKRQHQVQGLALGILCNGKWCEEIGKKLPKDYVKVYYAVMSKKQYKPDMKLKAKGLKEILNGQRIRKLRMSDRALFREEQEERELACGCGPACPRWCCNKPPGSWCWYYCGGCTRRALKKIVDPTTLTEKEREEACNEIKAGTRAEAVKNCKKDADCIAFVRSQANLDIMCQLV